MTEDIDINHSTAAAPEAIAAEPGRARRSSWLIGAGVLIAAAIAGGVIMSQSGTPKLSVVPRSQVAALKVTLPPQAAQKFAADAQACTIPLAEVQIWHDPGAPDAVVTLQSGSYVSPPFALTATPEIIAVPFPAAYAVGSGQLVVHGNATAMNISLSPTKVLTNVTGAASVNVVWNTTNPCP